MKPINIVSLFRYDSSRFTSGEITFHLRRAIDEYFSRLFDDDDEDGIQLVDIVEDSFLTNAEIDRLFGGNT
jgi:hypothetical protein